MLLSEGNVPKRRKSKCEALVMKSVLGLFREQAYKSVCPEVRRRLKGGQITWIIVNQCKGSRS